MTWQYLPYVIVLASSSIAAILIAAYAWKRRATPGGLYFVLLMAAVAVWSMSNAAEYVTLATPTKILWTKISYLGIVSVSPLWLLFALGYSQRTRWLTPVRSAILWVVPVATLIMTATNEWHWLYWPTIEPISDAPGAALVYGHGLAVWLFVANSYVLLLAGTVLLVRTTLRSPQLYRQQVAALLVAVVIPWLGNLAYMLGLSPLPGLDVAPVAFTLTGAVTAWAIFRFHVLDLVPVAHDAVVENMGDGVLVLDAQNRVADLNPAAARLIGYSTASAVGQPARAVLSGWPELVAHCQDTSESEAEIHLQEDPPRWLYIRVSPLHERRGRRNGCLIVLHDITARKEAEAALQRYVTELEARNAELDAFAHTVAHDLKNPLSVMIGYGEMLQEDHDQLGRAIIERGLHDIVKAGRKMGSIIDELLLLASVRKTEQVQVKPLDMGTIAAEAQRRLRNMIAESQAEIHVPESWPQVQGYAPWVEEVWVNYLSNALKYGGTPPHIELGFDTITTAEMGAASQVRFWVQDNGQGLDQEQQKQLFAEFTRLDQGREGHGLGLSIVRRIVEKLGGQVGVESQVGQGSRFYFSLPAPDPPPA